MSAANLTVRPANGLPTTKPEEVGFATDRLSRIGPSMQKYIDAREIPGVLTVVARHGRIVHFQCHGLMDIEAEKPMAGNTIFRIMSMTKPIASVALMMLYEEGHFLLDQPIASYLPAFKGMHVKGKRGMMLPANREINFRDVLTHTAGFSNEEYTKISARFRTGGPPKGKLLVPGTTGKAVNDPARTGTVEESLELFAKAPLDFQPGTEWEYFAEHPVLGALIEKISGQRLDKFLQDRILDPLKMVDTHFHVPAAKVDRFAAGYATDLNKWGQIGLTDSPATSARVAGPKTYFSAGGGLHSTAVDYARFAQMLLNGGELDGARILGRKTIELMTLNHTGNLEIPNKGPGYGFGLGFCVRTSLTESPVSGSLGAYGWGGAFGTYYFADPKEDLFGLFFTQVRDNPPSTLRMTMRKDFDRMVYQALVGA